MKHLLTCTFFITVLLGCTTEKDVTPGDEDVFTKFYGTINSDEAFSISPSNESGYILVGTNEAELGEESISKIHVVKIDNEGNIIWDNLYPNTENEVNDKGEYINYAGRDIINTGNGYMIVGDSIYSEDMSSLLILSIAEDGTMTQENSITHSVGSLHGYAIEASTTTGNFIVLAAIENNDQPENMFLAEINNAIQPLWQQEYGIGDQGALSKSIYTAENTISWSGSAIRNGSEQDVRIISTPPNSKNTYFDETVGLNNGKNEMGVDIKKTPVGYVITGTTDNTPGGDNDMFIMSVNNNGQLLWTKNFGGPQDESGDAVTVTSDNYIVALGSTQSFSSGERDMLLIKTDLLGNEIWSTQEDSDIKTFGGINDEFGADIIESNDGGFLLLGTADFGDIGTMILIKTTKDGIL